MSLSVLGWDFLQRTHITSESGIANFVSSLNDEKEDVLSKNLTRHLSLAKSTYESNTTYCHVEIIIVLLHQYWVLLERSIDLFVPRQLYQGNICHLYVEEHHLRERNQPAVPWWYYRALPDFPQVLTFSTLFLNRKQYSYIIIKYTSTRSQVKLVTDTTIKRYVTPCKIYL